VTFRVLFDRLYPELHRYLYRLTGDADAADDAAQESFVRLLDNPLPEAEAKRWLFTVGTNLVRDVARARSRRSHLKAVYYEGPADEPSPDASAESAEAIEAVRAALHLLPERDRRMLLMREEGFRYREIADAVGVKPGSVGTLLARATTKFADAYRTNRGHVDAPR
jgi:RNA polymerase sigma-70 factor (ECF subfamily)